MPFSDCRITVMPGGRLLGTSVGMPMPRLTYEPSASSAAARAAISWRVRAMSVLSFWSLSLSKGYRATLDALFDVGADLDDPVHVDARQVDRIRVEIPRLDELLHLCDADPPRHRRERVEVARGLVEHEVAVTVALGGVHEREVGLDRLLEHELL